MGTQSKIADLTLVADGRRVAVLDVGAIFELGYLRGLKGISLFCGSEPVSLEPVGVASAKASGLPGQLELL